MENKRFKSIGIFWGLSIMNLNNKFKKQRTLYKRNVSNINISTTTSINFNPPYCSTRCSMDDDLTSNTCSVASNTCSDTTPTKTTVFNQVKIDLNFQPNTTPSLSGTQTQFEYQHVAPEKTWSPLTSNDSQNNGINFERNSSQIEMYRNLMYPNNLNTPVNRFNNGYAPEVLWHTIQSETVRTNVTDDSFIQSVQAHLEQNLEQPTEDNTLSNNDSLRGGKIEIQGSQITILKDEFSDADLWECSPSDCVDISTKIQSQPPFEDLNQYSTQKSCYQHCLPDQENDKDIYQYNESAKQMPMECYQLESTFEDITNNQKDKNDSDGRVIGQSNDGPRIGNAYEDLTYLIEDNTSKSSYLSGLCTEENGKYKFQRGVFYQREKMESYKLESTFEDIPNNHQDKNYLDGRVYGQSNDGTRIENAYEDLIYLKQDKTSKGSYRRNIFKEENDRYKYQTNDYHKYEPMQCYQLESTFEGITNNQQDTNNLAGRVYGRQSNGLQILSDKGLIDSNQECNRFCTEERDKDKCQKDAFYRLEPMKYDHSQSTFKGILNNQQDKNNEGETTYRQPNDGSHVDNEIFTKTCLAESDQSHQQNIQPEDSFNAERGNNSSMSFNLLERLNIFDNSDVPKIKRKRKRKTCIEPIKSNLERLSIVNLPSIEIPSTCDHSLFQCQVSKRQNSWFSGTHKREYDVRHKVEKWLNENSFFDDYSE